MDGIKMEPMAAAVAAEAMVAAMVGLLFRLVNRFGF